MELNNKLISINKKYLREDFQRMKSSHIVAGIGVAERIPAFFT